MFCSKCGTENKDGAKFCKACGNLLTSEKSVKSESSNIMAVKPKHTFIKVLIAAMMAVIVIVIIAFVVINSRNTINLNKYVTVESAGYNGYATASISIDWDAIEKKYGNRLSFKSAARSEYGGFLTMMSPVEIIQQCVSTSLDKKSRLSNGDSIKYTLSVDDELSKYVNCKVKFKDGSYKISGLKKADTFDAFAGLTVEYSGIAPEGRASINYTGSDMNYYDFKMDSNNGLNNGDTVTVSIDDKKIENYINKLGKVPAEFEKKYTVDGLEKYLSKNSELDDEFLTEMCTQAEDVYNAKVARDWGEEETLETLTYIGNYLLTAKDPGSVSHKNYMFLVYKVQVRDNYTYKENTFNELCDIYWYIRYTDLVIGTDGTAKVDFSRYETPGDRFTVDSGLSNGWWSAKSWYYYGYQTLEELYKNAVTKNIDKYNHEDTVDESIAPKPVKSSATPDASEADNAVADSIQTEDGTGYIIPDSNIKLLTKADLVGMSEKDCKIARNEIYARHGRKFGDKELQEYFDSCDWYEGTIEPDAFKESDLSSIEIANRDLIVKYEEEQGYR